MKKAILFILPIALIINACKKGDNLSAVNGCPVDSFISASYLNDAREMIYRRILTGQPVQGSNDPEFNQDEVNRVLSAITSVYALHTPTTDSLFNTVQIHAYKVYLLNSIIFKVNMDAPEIKSLIANHVTGNADFDGLMVKYGFTYDGTYPPVASLPFATINSATWYNMHGLIPLFAKFPFVSDAQSNGTVGDGNNITYQINGTKRILDFSIGFGDCPAGCGGRKTWEFTVDESCNAAFVKVF